MSGVPLSRARARAPWRAALAALSFLTRIPIGRAVALDAGDVARAGPVFPVVGAGIGAAVGALAAALAGTLSAPLAVALALAVSTLLTGALHLDALADTADALGASSREHALQIMRDPTIGSFGAAAIGLDLLLKLGALTALVHDQRVVRFAVAAGALSRVAPVILAATLPYARTGEGAGAALTRGGRARAAVATPIAIAIAIAVAGLHGAELATLTLALVAALAVGFHRWGGGVTGDLLGTAIELTETATLVLAVALAGGK